MKTGLRQAYEALLKPDPSKHTHSILLPALFHTDGIHAKLLVLPKTGLGILCLCALHIMCPLPQGFSLP